MYAPSPAAPMRLAELVGALALATDLGLGLPQEHVLRQSRITLALADAIAAPAATRGAAYYVALLAWVGCSSDSHEIATAFGDDLELRSRSYDGDLAGRGRVTFLLRNVGPGESLRRRSLRIAMAIADRGRQIDRSRSTHCVMAARMAEQLGLGPAVTTPLRHVFERWDGSGQPAGLRGPEIPLAARLVPLADMAEVHHRRGGLPAAIAAVRARAGSRFDPALTEAFCDHAEAILGPLEETPSWGWVLDAEPRPHQTLTGNALEDALAAIGDFADLKAPCFTGHARAVSRWAAAAADRAGLPAQDTVDVRRAGLVQDVGRIGVPTTIWNRPRRLTAAEWERVRLHPYFTERILARSPAMARLGTLAATHHERLDRSGYHRGADGSTIPMAGRILAGADVYQALLEPRPHRPARETAEAAAVLRDEVRAGRLDGDAVEAVLAVAGHPHGRRAPTRPAGLTARELEVLILIARGASAREIARELTITTKTARNHTERIYRKIDVASRVEAAAYAMWCGLVLGR